jgi:hypothetical protein
LRLFATITPAGHLSLAGDSALHKRLLRIFVHILFYSVHFSQAP